MGQRIVSGVITARLTAALTLATLCSCGQRSNNDLGEGIAPGAQIFAEYCIRCHANGTGDQLNPPLIGSPALQDETHLARIILHGQAGESVVRGIMPAMPEMTDEEIAAAIAYIRSRFAGLSSSITAQQVGALRSIQPEF
jgi:mono/diheme cytochrome c family protein